MYYFILDNIYNSEISNGIFYRYQSLIENLLKMNEEVTLITHPVEKATYPSGLKVDFTSSKFALLIIYSELYFPYYLNTMNILENSVIISLSEYVTIYQAFYKLKTKLKCKLILGFHTNYNLYGFLIKNIQKTMVKFFRYYLYDMVDILLISGYSSKKMINKVVECRKKKPLKKLVWYHMDSRFLDIKPLRFTYDQLITILYCGRISDAQKKIFQLLEIYQNYCANYQQCQLTIIGNGPDFGTLQQRTRNDSNINLLGNIPNNKLPSVFAKLKSPVFVFPSTSETLGKSPLEASMLGIPVFTAISIETPYLYQDGQNGYVFTSTEECCQKINGFFQSSTEQKNKIIQNGIQLRERFRNKTEIVIDKIQNLR